ncbi:hypothetical protein [Phenylobacterium immobile]|uniref:hypothetical protein n=1 Tax=Phenylobacterium immobile TaxID=21 RepID=UPI000AC9EDB3|nr:hypothetical protein [Phenylobacterium immobile]
MSLHDRHKEFAAELAEAGMALARDIAEAALKAEAVADKIALAGAHERLARSVRLTIQLCERLERNAAQAERPSDQPDITALERRLAPQLDLRKAQVRAAVRRSIEQDYEGEDAEILERSLEGLLEEWALTRRFLDEPPMAMVSVLRRKLKLPDDLRVELPQAARAGPS